MQYYLHLCYFYLCSWIHRVDLWCHGHYRRLQWQHHLNTWPNLHHPHHRQPLTLTQLRLRARSWFVLDPHVLVPVEKRPRHCLKNCYRKESPWKRSTVYRNVPNARWDPMSNFEPKEIVVPFIPSKTRSKQKTMSRPFWDWSKTTKDSSNTKERPKRRRRRRRHTHVSKHQQQWGLDNDYVSVSVKVTKCHNW